MIEPTDAQITSLAYDCDALPECCTDESLRRFARAVYKIAFGDAIELAAQTADGERLGDHTEHPCDLAYNQAVRDCVYSIRALLTKEAS